MNQLDFSKNFKRRFADVLYKEMQKNKKIWVVVGDLGYKMWDPVRKDFPNRFINVGAAEHTMMGIAVGLALDGKIPFVYSISTFLLYRPFETIRNYVNHEKIPVRLVGGAREKDYLDDGISHWPLEQKEVLKLFNNITVLWPEDVEEIEGMVKKMVKEHIPWYINLKK